MGPSLVQSTPAAAAVAPPQPACPSSDDPAETSHIPTPCWQARPLSLPPSRPPHPPPRFWKMWRKKTIKGKMDTHTESGVEPCRAGRTHLFSPPPSPPPSRQPPDPPPPNPPLYFASASSRSSILKTPVPSPFYPLLLPSPCEAALPPPSALDQHDARFAGSLPLRTRHHCSHSSPTRNERA